MTRWEQKNTGPASADPVKETKSIIDLHHASLLQRDEPVGTQDQVIEDLDAEDLPRFDEVSGEEEIFSGRIGTPGRMVVEDDERRCVIVECEAQDIARGNHGAVERPNVDLPLAEDAIPRIEIDGSDPFLHVMPVPGDEPMPELQRVAERFSVVGD